MILQNDCEFTGVQWNPRMDNLFATSDNQGRVCLRDTRTSFGSALNRTRQPLEHVRPLLWCQARARLKSLGDSLSHHCRSQVTPHWRDQRLVLLPGIVKVGLELHRALICYWMPYCSTGLRLSVTMLVCSILCSKNLS